MVVGAGLSTTRPTLAEHLGCPSPPSIVLMDGAKVKNSALSHDGAFRGGRGGGYWCSARIAANTRAAVAASMSRVAYSKASSGVQSPHALQFTL